MRKKEISMERNIQIMEELTRFPKTQTNVSLSKFIDMNFQAFAKSGKSVREIYDFLKDGKIDVSSFHVFRTLFSKVKTYQKLKLGTKGFEIEMKARKNMKNLVYVGGSKGGTGKSMVCMALVDYFRKKFPQDEILLIETDSSNPDVGRLYRKTERVILRGLFLDEEDSAWMAMVDDIAKTPARHVIVNSMAASNLGIQNHGALLDKNILNGRLDVKFSVFWSMNRNKDSVVLLKDFLTWMQSATVYPVLNLYFGKEEEFLFYRTASDIQRTIFERGGQSIVFPSLNDLIADRLYTDEINLEELPSHLGLGMLTGLERWLSVVKDTFDQVKFAPTANETY